MVLRVLRAAVAGAIAWWAGLMGIFGAAQGVLGHPSLQSAKLNTIYSMPPAPRIAVDPWLLPLGIFVVALTHATVFAFIRRGLPEGLIARGLAFAAVSWGLMVPWFEFYLPWNLFLEPALLVGLEMLCWAGVLTLVGLAISLAYGRVDDARAQQP
jgi:hypothetical protein